MDYWGADIWREFSSNGERRKTDVYELGKTELTKGSIEPQGVDKELTEPTERRMSSIPVAAARRLYVLGRYII